MVTIKQTNTKESYSGFGTIIEIEDNKNKYVWLFEETGKRHGSDGKMTYEMKSTVTLNGKEIVNTTRFVSEYSDHTIEFHNTFSNILDKETFKEVKKQIHY